MNWQAKVRDFESEANLKTTVENRILDLTSEIGEVAKEALLGNNYGHQGFTKTKDWDSELGDCIYSLCSLANLTGTNLELALDTVLQKYRARLQEKGHAGSQI